MRTSRTLSLYLAREMVQYATLGFAAVCVVLVSQNLLRRMDELTAVGFTFADLLIVLRCLFPMLTAYAIPIALLFGAAIALRRMVTDSEVLAMRACGIGAPTLLIPTLALGIVVSLISGYLLLVVEHQARRDLIALFNHVAARGSILQAGKFSGLGKRMIYIGERDRENQLQRVMISDATQKQPVLIFAEHGHFFLDEETGRIHLRLGDGEIHLSTEALEPDEYQRVYFENFDYVIDVQRLVSGTAAPERPKQMTLAELHEVVERGRKGDPLSDLKKRDPVYYELEIQRRFALPLAPLLFAFAAVPLALLGAPSSRAWGPLLCAGVAFAYYALLTLFQFLARKGLLPPAMAFWLPNLMLFAVSLYQLRRAQSGLTP